MRDGVMKTHLLDCTNSISSKVASNIYAAYKSMLM